MKIIDLLNKIANGEEIPERIKYEKYIYKHIDNYCYYCDETNLILSDRIFAEYSRLNDEVEIIEEDKKIARLNQDNFQCVSNLEVSGQSANYFEYGIEDEIRNIVDKINEIIDYLNKEE